MSINIRNLSSDQVWDFENAFYWFSHPSRVSKLLAHYELYKKIVHLPGDIIELGVYKSASLVRFSTFRQILENENSRKIIGFDAFGEFPRENISLASDQDFIEAFEKTGGHGLELEEVNSIFKFKNINNFELVAGNVLHTLDDFLDRSPATRIALLHLDMDVKEPTQYALQRLYDRVVPEGLIVIDDYGSVAGATEAIDEFAYTQKLKIQKSPYYKIPAYIQKNI
ncbi:TylF/MycF/NovP-related O-methyltransferase [Comamonas sp.]|uniref:TylF/MycF/NovP-related O-methyltransferase n=1 Tax=Comamonas sp. TaxID=34028 RepID=UPI00258EF036|nr:TylF/MycF/NovP-related O-methyltransferase [Comamonas sp.]